MTSKYQLCPLCRGAKKVRHLGNMEKECVNCKEIGYVRIDLDTKKKGRPASEHDDRSSSASDRSK